MSNNDVRIADFLFEIGTMRKLLRSHRQTLLTDDMSDNIASHSYRVAIIGWVLANEEKADSSKVVKMCLLHDLGEIRTGDHNYIQKRYVKEFGDEVVEEQLGTLPHSDLKDLTDEYEERKSREAIITKDADMLDQILLLREYAWQGNQEAQIWLKGKGNETENAQYKKLKTKTAQNIAKAIYKRSPSAWWENLWTPENR
ncbi:MAG TPA: HD domain-containing protein [Candidatus Paceibacterota bacterium]|jgi:putative hydrolase of HD superfamily|nr:phosphohydrolase [Parcubacteria group bacterium]MDP6119724.1 HD domain-containing protein [Candidatus Paceibacterota bacterium]HJN62953.1 HD domain-containing protein [Candidatus Paceibacterota bacterium]|tara:strand:- start:2488 stop:3084 length:597 start_codon:yes stop_codon:yes gene_type:complete